MTNHFDFSIMRCRKHDRQLTCLSGHRTQAFDWRCEECDKEKLQLVNKANEDEEFLRMAEECGISKYLDSSDGEMCCYKHNLIALCKKVQDKQREKDVANQAEIERLRGLLKDAVNSGYPMGLTEPGKYCKSGEQISLREAILNELNGNTQR